LQQPTAARVTKCGHTYCLACIIHYLQLNDENEKPNKKWRKCPICWDSVYAKDLKSVRFWTVRTIGKVGDGGLLEGDEKLTMRLIQRPMVRKKIFVYPKKKKMVLSKSLQSLKIKYT
jgi:hypothetical protein